MTDAEKDARPYQYDGYPAFSEWMASSHDFFVLRRYSKESARCLLRLQHEIAKISKTLDDLDEYSRAQPVGFGGCDSFDDDKFPDRIKIIEYMEGLLQRYCKLRSQILAVLAYSTYTCADNLVNAFGQVRKNQTARPEHVQNLNNWFVNRPEAIDPLEQHFRDENKQSDLFPLVLKERSPLRLFLGQAKWLRLLFPPRNFAGQAISPSTHYTSETALDRLTNAIILIVGLCLLFGPMWGLHFINSNTNRLAIITGFVSAFTGLTFLAAGQRPFEILAATAAYAAVLMVYLQNSDG